MNRKFSFEKLEVWNLAMALAELVYHLTKGFPDEEKYGMTSQVRRAVVSVSSNLAEGGSRSSYKDKARFSNIAYSSLMELVSQMKLAHKLGWLSSDQLETFEINANELAVKLTRFRQSQVNRFQEPEIAYNTTDSKNTEPQHLNNQTPQHLNNQTPQHLNNPTPQHLNNQNTSTTHHLNNPTSQHSHPQYYAHPTATIDEGAQIGTNTKIWHYSHIMGGAKIGESCNLGQNVFIADGVELGRNVKVQNNVSIYKGVICEDDVFLGPSMVFTNVINPRSAVNRKEEYQQTRVQQGASIGANATIVCGNQIGRYAFIGAGSVVTKEVPDFALMAGNPAKQIGWMSKGGYRLNFDQAGIAVCQEEALIYRLADGKVQLAEEEPGYQDQAIPNKAK